MSTDSDLEPLLRDMAFPAELAEHAPHSSKLKLVTRSLAACAAAGEVNGSFADNCYITHVAGQQGLFERVRIQQHLGKAPLQNVHIAILSGQGKIDIAVSDSHSRVFVGTRTVCRVSMTLFRRPSVFIGDGTTMQQVRLIGANGDVVIGEDCLFSDEIILQSHDQHPLVSTATGELLNGHRRHIHLGRHVWIGRRAMVMPDVTIGAGSVIGAGAIVTKNVPAECVAVGIPARVIRENTSWLRHAHEVAEWQNERSAK